MIDLATALLVSMLLVALVGATLLVGTGLAVRLLRRRLRRLLRRGAERLQHAARLRLLAAGAGLPGAPTAAAAAQLHRDLRRAVRATDVGLAAARAAGEPVAELTRAYAPLRDEALALAGDLARLAAEPDPAVAAGVGPPLAARARDALTGLAELRRGLYLARLAAGDGREHRRRVGEEAYLLHEHAQVRRRLGQPAP